MLLTFVSCVACYLIGAATALFCFRMGLNHEAIPTAPEIISEPLEEEITPDEKQYQDQLQELWNYDPFAKPEERGEMNEKD